MTTAGFATGKQCTDKNKPTNKSMYNRSGLGSRFSLFFFTVLDFRETDTANHSMIHEVKRHPLITQKKHTHTHADLHSSVPYTSNIPGHAPTHIICQCVSYSVDFYQAYATVNSGQHDKTIFAPRDSQFFPGQTATIRHSPVTPSSTGLPISILSELVLWTTTVLMTPTAVSSPTRLSRIGR